jgi:hypothetical protein
VDYAHLDPSPSASLRVSAFGLKLELVFRLHRSFRNDELKARRLLRLAALDVTTLCRPNTWNKKTRLKLNRIEALKNEKKGFDRSVDRTVELGFDFCFQQDGYGGWVSG